MTAIDEIAEMLDLFHQKPPSVQAFLMQELRAMESGEPNLFDRDRTTAEMQSAYNEWLAGLDAVALKAIEKRWSAS